MENVTLLDGIFKESQEKGKEYLVYLDIDRLIAPCYEAVSQTPKKVRYGGWESTPISGHSIGHWLSAASAMYTVTKDEELLNKIEYAVNELALVQSFDEDGYVSGFPRTYFDKVFTGDFEVENFSLAGGWVPWYSIHKIFAGLIDVYSLTGNNKALEVVTKLSDWAKKGTDNLNDEQFQRMLICEHGGMNEAMADLYTITNNEDYLKLAIRFCHHAILDPLSKEIDELEGKHANTQIPKVIGAAKLYEITGNEDYKNMAVFFWNEVTKNRSYIIGGNSIGEHFGPVNKETLGITTAETCNTYNMLKLTEHLFQWNHKTEYIDYYERALYNHILASQDPDSGMKTYFVSTQPGHFKIYCSPDNSFWCCTGTGMENPARYTRNIYYQEQEDLFVNLFIASELIMDEKKIKLRQETDFPRSNKVRLYFEEAAAEFLNVHIRVPYWVSGALTVFVNGVKTNSISENGYVTIGRNWSGRDTIEFTLPMDLHTYTAKDNPRKVGFMYGPVVLAGALGKENFPESDILEDHLKLNNYPLIDVPSFVADKVELKQWIKPVEGFPLTFETDKVGQPGNQKITLVPFYNLHHQRYTLYWNLMDEEAYKTFVDKEKEELEKLRVITVDVVQPGEQQPEIEHRVNSKNSQTGYFNVVEKSWRDSRGEGFFSYEMLVEPDKKMYLQVTYFGRDKTLFADGKKYERDFEIVIDGQLVATQKLEGNHSDGLFNIYYEIPLTVTEGKQQVEVKFQSGEGKAAGGVYEVRVINSLSK
ncbi:glycoside hydrolase family 127 protein [Bacillus sp. ISL-40]|uniref:glycoside hydrolase family 127 protein n=1 Tax=unclassified Bacillus (in: firmicutes) TaxID=185979 RepID=UPI001BE5BB43|nr:MULTISPECIES: glycoside hydrolase family 127 protein [unclassified Bacillus (in: firmicutes)]MBT2700509.1 glycoside hydrolase family 127 protein [Bacillus sp. ISL-40]MBT2742777.1 glycoside hydrolase family 127 protein [Bacillus sp. ISL-77]